MAAENSVSIATGSSQLIVYAAIFREMGAISQQNDALDSSRKQTFPYCCVAAKKCAKRRKTIDRRPQTGARSAFRADALGRTGMLNGKNYGTFDAFPTDGQRPTSGRRRATNGSRPGLDVATAFASGERRHPEVDRGAAKVVCTSGSPAKWTPARPSVDGRAAGHHQLRPPPRHPTCRVCMRG